jgi:hypothetical protein
VRVSDHHGPVVPGRDRPGPAFLAAIALAIVAGAFLYLRPDGASIRTTEGSGVASVQSRAVPAFHAVELAGGANVTIRVGGRRSVQVRADDNLVSRVTTVVRDGRLVLGERGALTTRTPIGVSVTVPGLDAVALSGGGIIAIDGVRAAAFSVSVPGGGSLRASGRARRLDAVVQGAGDVQLDGLAARDATVRIDGAGRLRVQATRSLDATVAGVGEITYTGHPPRVTQRITGTGWIAPE